jgi:uncharacterized protein (DUF697 family)
MSVNLEKNNGSSSTNQAGSNSYGSPNSASPGSSPNPGNAGQFQPPPGSQNQANQPYSQAANSQSPNITPAPQVQAPLTIADQCRKTIKTCAIISGAIAFIPIPVGDSVAITITQFIMVSTLCGRYNRSMGASIILIILSAMFGPLVFNLLLSFIPFLGWLLEALVGGMFTYYVGSITHHLLQQNQSFTFGNFIEGFKAVWGAKRNP